MPQQQMTWAAQTDGGFKTLSYSKSFGKLRTRLHQRCAGFEYSYLDLPLGCELCHQDLSNNFARKIHALLCRPFIKGPGWYDFTWYVTKGILPNYRLLDAAIEQPGHWKDQRLAVQGRGARPR
ncbi:MAG: hypothetical protein ABI304_03955 [Rudaea sp.]